MKRSFSLVLVILIGSTIGFLRIPFHRISVYPQCPLVCKRHHPLRFSSLVEDGGGAATTAVEEAIISENVTDIPLPEVLAPVPAPVVDLSKYYVGQVVEGKIIKFNGTCLVAEIPGKDHVYFPKYKADNVAFQKLRIKHRHNWIGPLRLIIDEIDAEKQLLTVKAFNPDTIGVWKHLANLHASQEIFNTTVIQHFDYGINVRIDQYLTEAFIPLSKLPIKHHLKEVFP
jgi:hypothetical protein